MITLSSNNYKCEVCQHSNQILSKQYLFGNTLKKVTKCTNCKAQYFVDSTSLILVSNKLDQDSIKKHQEIVSNRRDKIFNALVLLGIVLLFGGVIIYSIHKGKLDEIARMKEDVQRRNLANQSVIQPIPVKDRIQNHIITDKRYRLGGMVGKNVRYVKAIDGKLATVGLTDGAIDIMQHWNSAIKELRDVDLIISNDHADITITLSNSTVKQYRLTKQHDFYGCTDGKLQFIVKPLSDTRFKFSIANMEMADGFVVDNEDFLSAN